MFNTPVMPPPAPTVPDLQPALSTGPIIGQQAARFQWVENWVRLPGTDSARANGRTHGVVISEQGYAIVFNQSNPAILVYDQTGALLDAWGDRFPGAHGLTLVKEGDAEYLWLTDSSTGEVVKTTLDGQPIMSIQRPTLRLYRQGAKYAPTWVAVHEESKGGNGDIWVTDGYGSNYIHAYDKAGNYLDSINGSEGGAGPFKCPHGIFIDYRKDEPELYIADRGNRRVQVYDIEGNFKRVFGAELLTSPCGFATSGELLLIPELRARIAILDSQDHLVCYLGENEAVCDVPGWPNHPAQLIQPGKFNSPHGITADAAGNLYIVEWIIGGRITKLVRL
ncbi:MAG TPA: 6-bladed beta-propeller [Caldilineaceae bacterium]|nr:6-bladed beta-propeller [Caldilineaceae bacterium]